jgi:hypothetical protein
MRKIRFSLGVVVTSILVLVVFGLTKTTTQEVEAQSVDTGVIWVDTEKNIIQGSAWAQGANITVTVKGEEFSVATGEGGNFWIDFGTSGIDIQPGDTVTATHAGNTVTNVVQPSSVEKENLSFSFTQVEFSENYQGERNATITGTAPQDGHIVLWLSQMGWTDQGPTRTLDEVMEVTPDPQTGVWSATFATTETKPFAWKDIHAFIFYDNEGIPVRLHTILGVEAGQVTPGGSITEGLADVDWLTANATFLTRFSDPGSHILNVSPQTNIIQGHDFPFGNLVVTIERGSQTFTYDYGLHTGGGFEILYDHHRVNIQPGDVVTATIGEFSMNHTVLDLEITSIDPVNNKIYGTSSLPYSEEYNNYVTVQLGVDYADPGTTRVVETDVNGNWVADFSVTQIDPWGSGSVFPVADITADVEFWFTQGGAPLEGDFGGKMAWSATLMANQKVLIPLVRSFIVTRMAEFAALQTNISAVLDDPSQQLIFESPGLGKISFSTFDIDTLLVINPEYLENLADFVNIAYDSENNTLSSKVETSTLDFLAGHSATIQFFNVAKNLGVTGLTTENIQDYIDIKVYDGNVLVTDITDYFDWDNVTYNSETDILTLPVNHFTEYVLGTSSELPETGMNIVYILSLAVLGLVGLVVVKKYNVLS